MLNVFLLVIKLCSKILISLRYVGGLNQATKTLENKVQQSLCFTKMAKDISNIPTKGDFLVWE